MKNPEDFWAEDEFEDIVASALIACYETKAKKNSGAAPADRLNESHLAMMRQTGPYISSNSRFADLTSDEPTVYQFDMVNDTLPKLGCHAVKTPPGCKAAEAYPGSYMHIFHLRQVQTLGKHWVRRGGGVLYEVFSMAAESDGIAGERQYITVDKGGRVLACTQRFVDNNRHGAIVEHPEEWLNDTAAWGAVSLQTFADRRFCWTITAEEKIAKAHIGCMQEEIKSLLYARSLPVSETGRKRPILHLIESHKRRLKNGTDIDITPFLRGIQTVEINGTIFKVSAPTNIKNGLTVSSQKKYYAADEA